jgi:hypothetical protein
MGTAVAYRARLELRMRREVLMSGRMKAVLAALAALGFAALNGSWPWGP